MRKLLTIIAAITLIVMAASFSRGERDYSRWTSIPDKGWAFGDTLYLLPTDTTLPDNDTIVRRRLHIGLTHDNDYPYSNVWLEVTVTGSGKRYRYTLDIPLADVYGRWIGSGFGSDYQRDVIVTTDADIDLTSPIEVRHIMRLDTLQGLNRIGILVD